MRNIKLTIEYDGTDFKGWQIQGKGERTVQAEITRALELILSERITLVGSGRTDSGVHALGQTANFHTQSTLNAERLQKALNANLPPDIAIINVEDVPDRFHAQNSAKYKTYRYTILNRDPRSALEYRRSLYYPFPLNVSAMKAAAKFIIGKHDFRTFQATDPRRKERDTVRAVTGLTIKKTGDLIHIDVTANGFLYKMVRNIVGTLLEVGGGRRAPSDIQKILHGKNRVLAGETAKPHALTLLCVEYDK